MLLFFAFLSFIFYNITFFLGRGRKHKYFVGIIKFLATILIPLLYICNIIVLSFKNVKSVYQCLESLTHVGFEVQQCCYFITDFRIDLDFFFVGFSLYKYIIIVFFHARLYSLRVNYLRVEKLNNTCWDTNGKMLAVNCRVNFVGQQYISSILAYMYGYVIFCWLNDIEWPKLRMLFVKALHQIALSHSLNNV